MRYTVEDSLRNFKFWSGGKERADMCSPSELDAIEEFLEETEPEGGWTDGDINDMFWFEFDTLAQHLGYEDEEDFTNQHDPDYVDDDQLSEYCPEWFRGVIDGLIAHMDGESLDKLATLADRFGFYSVEKDDEKFAMENYNFLASITDGGFIFQNLFADDYGNDVFPELIPTLEVFRMQIMDKIARENHGQTAE